VVRCSKSTGRTIRACRASSSCGLPESFPRGSLLGLALLCAVRAEGMPDVVSRAHRLARYGHRHCGLRGRCPVYWRRGPRAAALMGRSSRPEHSRAA
jgi:hypothetical protein